MGTGACVGRAVGGSLVGGAVYVGAEVGGVGGTTAGMGVTAVGGAVAYVGGRPGPAVPLGAYVGAV